MQLFLRDVLYHLRVLRRKWPFTLLIVLCLALGVGANSTVFSVVNAVLLRPLPFENPDELVILLETLNDENYNANASNLFDWRRRSSSFTSLEAMATRFFNVSGGESPERIPGGAVSAGFFKVLGIQPMLGRSFSAEEDVPGGARVAMISYGLFEQRFGADPNVLERPLHLEGESYEIVGVMPPGAESFFPRRFLVAGAELWVPLRLDPAAARNQARFLYVVGRLAQGVDLKGAQAEMTTLAARLSEEFPDTNADWGVELMSLRENWVGKRGRNLLLLLAAVGFVLLIACANVSNLLIARAAEQQSQMALRMAFGAGRRHVLRQFLTESVLLALIGGLVGFALTLISLRVVPLMLPSRLHLQLRDVGPDYRVLLFTFLVALLAGVAPGMLAAWRILSLDLLPQLGEGTQRSGGGMEGRRLRDGLVVLEVALTLVLLVGAVLMVKSLGRLSGSHIGFDPENLLTFSITPPSSRYGEITEQVAFYREIQDGIRVLPGVRSVGVTSDLPVTRFAVVTRFLVENRVPEKPGEVLMADYRHVDPDYFETLGLTLRQGRDFSDSDTLEATPVAVVSTEMAERFWPGGQAVGRRLIRASQLQNGTWMTVVGVVDEIQEGDMGTELSGRGTLYTPYTQLIWSTMYMSVRSSVEPASLLPSIHQVVRTVDPDQPIADVETMDVRIGKSLSDHRFEAIMLMIFSGLSVTLALVGIYGVLSYTVSQRIREMGVRMALGATTRDIVVLILRRTMTLALVGLTAGLIVALVLSRFLSSMLYEVEPTDLMTFAGTFLALVLTCAAAGFRPAWRASRYDPVLALRQE